jgi:hypothetical protein
MPRLTSRLTRSDFQGLAETRLREAGMLLGTDGYDGAIYLAGYAIECALKACIAKQTQQYEFPDRDTVNRSYTHNLGELVGLAGPELKGQYDAKILSDDTFKRDWAIVSQWHEEDRYRSDASGPEARDFIGSVGRIVEWIRQIW